MSRNWTKPALAVSLAINLLVAGAVGGALLTDRGPGRGGPTGGPPELRSFERGLEPERRDALRARLREDPALRGGRARLRATRGELVSVLRAEPFDADAFRAALSAQRAVQTELVTRALEAMVLTAQEMAPNERAALADVLARRRR
ncbi:Uncharacterized membrane protein [Jannaschia seohaensis]|uniref:Putative membrane protein n=1 Tax=Jannaschia seohaensis TaxID=475081 RepID=A0A2Y9AEF4_9RHOB|nr:putative membrane protein [Jannaschia seohaensis]SSA41648.1 Uncharacterized membrane protein [Jannaschia seohaensis]